MRILLSSLLVLGLLAGCFEGGSRDVSDESAPDAADNLAVRLAANLPSKALQTWDAKEGVDWWETFSTTYVKRDVGLPNNELAAQAIAAGLTDAGLDVTILHYVPGLLAAPAIATPGAGIHVVMAIKTGIGDPGHGIALGAHYDTLATTVQGAFDNGAGTAMVYELCGALSQVPMNRTLVCLFFDGEEEGTLASQAFADSPPANAPDIDFFFGYDMVGINWPGYPTWKLYNWVQEEYSTDLYPFVNATVTDVLGWPYDGAEAFPFNDRNSDEATFIAKGIPTVRFAGGRSAGLYDEYHMPDDTVDHIYQMVGGRANFELGFGAIAQESYALALLLDQTNLLELQAAAA